MKSIEHNEDDKYSPSDVTVSVKCKPKMIYPSDGTNWANDLYEDRLIFHDEHEISENGNTPRNTQEYIPEGFIQTVIFLRDSLLQFEIITIEGDFIRLKSGGDHLKREEIRLTVLSNRIESALKYNDGHLISTVTNISVTYLNSCELKKLKQKLNNLADIVSSDVTVSKNFLINSFNELTFISRSIRMDIEKRSFPKHRAVVIQTSDAGPGVSCHKRITQIRLAEASQIHNLDLQARVHYAPNDSRTYIVEKVMRSLNEHAGDGTTISLPVVHSSELESLGVLLNMSQMEIMELRKQQDEEVAI